MRRKLAMVAFAVMLMSGAMYGGPLNIVTNGSFENGSFVANSWDFMELGVGAPNITGWTIIPGTTVPCIDSGSFKCAAPGIDWNKKYWQAADGDFSLDLNGLMPGGVQQSLSTVVGQQYRLSFALAGNPDALPNVKVMITDPTGGSPYQFNVVGQSKSDMGWETESFSFKATSTTTVISFTSDTTSPLVNINWDGLDQRVVAFGPALDNVSVDPVPEPGSLLLLGTGLLGAAGFIRRKIGV